jgi:hypothetical protein
MEGLVLTKKLTMREQKNPGCRPFVGNLDSVLMQANIFERGFYRRLSRLLARFEGEL